MKIRLCSTSAVRCGRAVLAAVVAVCFGWISGAAAAAQGDAAGLKFFENRIRPVFAEHCYSCHSAEAKSVKCALKLDTKEDFFKGGTDGVVVVAGQPDQSRLIRAVRQDDPDLQMPPKKSGGKKLTDGAIADLVQWVKMGAPYPETPASRKAAAPRLWALEPVKDPSPPAVKNKAWLSTSVDSFILAKIEKSGLRPAARADQRTLIRRATFDLTGLPPTPEEIDSFLADHSTNAFALVVDRLLNSPRYGEHWGRHWLDVVRYADTAGDTADYPLPEAWRYRNYVIDSFNAVYEHDKRSVYLMVQRIKRHPFLALFDGADPNSSTAERRITTVPTQALYFLNDPFVHAKSVTMAERLQAARATESGQIELASLLAFGRSTTGAEQTEATEFLASGRSELKSDGVADPDRAALAAYVRTLFGSNEFLHWD